MCRSGGSNAFGGRQTWLRALHSFDPLRANLQIYCGMAQDIWLAARCADKLCVLYKHPGWRPADAAAQAPRPSQPLAQFRCYEPPLPQVLKRHALLQLAVLVAFFCMCWRWDGTSTRHRA